MYLLQQDIQLFAQPDPRSTLITVVVFGALILVGVIAALINSRRGGGGKSGRAGGRFKREARRLGLDRDHTAALISLVRTLNLQSPDRLFANDTYLNHALKKRIEQIDASPEKPEADREVEKAHLFQARRIIENSRNQLRVLPSSRHIRVGQEIAIQSKGGGSYQSSVVSNVHNGLGIEVPFDRRTGRVQWPKGAPLQVTFVTDPNRLFFFQTRVLAYNNRRGASVMFVEHAANIKQRQKRRSPRREYDRPCYFYPVSVYTVGRGRRAKKQAFVNKNARSFGRFEDLSAGGCAIRTQSALQPESFLKVDFDTADGASISAFGKVRSTDRRIGKGTLMHIMFTRVSRKNLNRIQSYVYGIADE